MIVVKMFTISYCIHYKLIQNISQALTHSVCQLFSIPSSNDDMH
jgi:hypothetical protein